MNDRRASVLRGLARQVAAVGREQRSEWRIRWFNDMADEVLDGLADYQLAAALMAFIQGPLQHRFVLRYADDINADGDRIVLRMYDDPDTRAQAVGMAVHTGRMIRLDDAGTHWEFAEARNPLELLQWATREGVRPGETWTEGLPMSFLQGALERIAVAASRHGAPKREEPGGQYL